MALDLMFTHLQLIGTSVEPIIFPIQHPSDFPGLTLFQPGGGVESTPYRSFRCPRSECQLIDFKLSDVYDSLSRHNLTKNQVHSLSGVT